MKVLGDTSRGGFLKINMPRFIINETSYHGTGAIRNLVPEIKKRGYNRVFVVTDANLIKNNIAQKVTNLLDKDKIKYEIFSKVKQNPTVEIVKEGLERLNAFKADVVLAIGGGSSIDTAKAIAIVATNPAHKDILSLEGVNKTANPALPIIAVATTCGSAAEVTINYVLTDEVKKRKFVCVDVHDIPVLAIVDPELMYSLPSSLIATTGMDALTHAIEGYITVNSWEMSDMLHLRAIELIADYLKPATTGKPYAITKMALAEYIAGMGFSNSGLGLCHAMSHAVSALYDTPHGLANAIILPTVMNYNADYSGNKYREIAKAFGINDARFLDIAEVRKLAIDNVKKLALSIGIPKNLIGIIKKKDIRKLAELAINDICIDGNPREVSIESIMELFNELLVDTCSCVL